MGERKDFQIPSYLEIEHITCRWAITYFVHTYFQKQDGGKTGDIAHGFQHHHWTALFTGLTILFL
jgi:hypothetical protein